MSGGTLATVILAARNEERHLAECLRSLQGQTWKPIEIIVVDDGSTDRTAEIARSFDGVRVISHPNIGKARSVNGAAREARGEILLFLDGDLVVAQDYLERLVAPIVAGECIGTGHGTERVANAGNTWAACYQTRAGLLPDRRLNLDAAQLAEGSVVFRAVRKADFLRVGGFDDIGYLDDQTLSPKLGVRARWVTEAVCSHYNPETLGEVWAAGVWAGHSILHLHGFKAAWRFQPLLSAWRAIGEARSKRRAALAIYATVYDSGVWWGLLGRLLRRRRRPPAAGPPAA